MPINISYNSTYKSITSFPNTDLPNFVVLTGRNGSGKSHVLEAMKEGNLVVDCASDAHNDIVLYDWNSIVPTDTGSFIPAQVKIEQAGLFGIVRAKRAEFQKQFFTFADQNNLDPEEFNSPRKIRKLLKESEFSRIVPVDGSASDLYKKFKVTIQKVAKNISSHALNRNSELHQAAQKIFQTTPEALILDDEATFFKRRPFLWGEVDPFQQAFAKLFTTYRDLLRENLVLVGAANEGYEDRPPLSNEEFRVLYGRPPWDFVNEVLENNRFDFRIDHPKPSDDGSYEPKLTKLSKDVEMKFQDLSSGERVLMSFALCLYNSIEKRQHKTFPKLLLLDEVDAPLHPAMVRFLLDTIQTTLVKENNVSVILTTHSATTVGLAPESSIYLMEASPPKITKTTKSNALSILTEGVPTMSISFDGRRQVFVESPKDAKVFDRLYQLYKSELPTEKSLSFVVTGSPNSEKHDQNTGCGQVRKIVNTLAQAGNATVLGLVDWDGNQIPTERVHVLCPGARNGLENLLLDPVLVIACLTHAKPDIARSVGVLGADETFRNLHERSVDQWQAAVDRIVSKTLPADSKSGAALTTVEYLNGMKINVPTIYLVMDDHELERRVREVFPILKQSINVHGSLNYYVANVILEDYRDLIPIDLINTFKGLLECDAPQDAYNFEDA